MPDTRLVLAGALTAALALTGCGQPEPANDNPAREVVEQPETEPTILRSPVPVDEVPTSPPLPGPDDGPITGDPGLTDDQTSGG